MAEVKYTDDNIRTLEWNKHIRQRPGMYIGRLGNGDNPGDGIYVLLKEIVDNSIDEFSMGFGKQIQITVSDNTVTIRDFGRGIPLDSVVKATNNLNTGGKFDDSAFKKSVGLNGVGTKAVNALSSSFYIESFRDGQSSWAKYERGILLDSGKKDGVSERSGTYVSFIPDTEMFGNYAFNMEYVETMVKNYSYLKKGLTLTLNGTSYKSENGLLDLVNERMEETPLYPPIHLEDTDIEIVLTHGNSYGENIASFVNGQNTRDGGTHLAAYREAIAKTLKDFFKKDYDPQDFRQGIVGAISIQIQEPNFEGQTKTKLGNSEAKTFVQRVMTDKLGDWFDAHPAEAKSIIQKAIEASRARIAAKKARESTRRKSIFESAGMPDKLKDCQSNNPEECELFIVEGDSAGGSAIQGRNPITQAILPLRGKILNTERASIDRMLKSDTIESLITAIGGGYGEDFDVSKVRYHKIIIMADADVDGAHIATLNLTLFFRYMRPMITAGYVYVAMPPLYRIKWTKGPHSFVYTDAERDRVLREGKESGRQLPKGEGIQRYKGLGEMTYQELWETTMDPDHRILKQIHIEDAAQADETFSMLMGDEVEPRRLFIQRNAHDARFIDA